MSDPCAARDCEREPTLGLLCAMDGSRLADHYGAREGIGDPDRPRHGLPWMWDHLATAYPSLAGRGGGGRGGGVDDPEAERLAAVIVLRQEIHDHVTITAAELADDLGRRGPQEAPSARLRVHRAAAWLLAHIEPLRSGQGSPAPDERVAALLAEADDLASRAHALAPWRPAPDRLDGIPCRCGSVGTVYDLGDVRKCARCGRAYTEHEWAVLMRVLARRFAGEGQSA